MIIFIVVVCALGTVSWLLQIVFLLNFRETFLKFALCFNFAHLLVEDGMQVVLYAIVASGNATSGTEDNTKQVIIGIAACTQSFFGLLFKAHDLFSDQELEKSWFPRHGSDLLRLLQRMQKVAPAPLPES